MFDRKIKNIFTMMIVTGCIFTFCNVNSLIFAQENKDEASTSSTTTTDKENTTQDESNNKNTSNSDKLFLSIDLGLVLNVSIPSADLSSTQVAGLSLFFKQTELNNLYEGLELLWNARYSGFSGTTSNLPQNYDVRMDQMSLGSSIKFKINEYFSVLAGLDLGLSYGKKYLPEDKTDSFYRMLLGVITNIDYVCFFNPYLHIGARFNFNFGPVSNMQPLVYVGLSF